MSKLEDLKKESDSLVQKIRLESKELESMIVESEKAILLNIGILLNTDYYTNVKPLILQNAYKFGKTDAELGILENSPSNLGFKTIMPEFLTDKIGVTYERSRHLCPQSIPSGVNINLIQRIKSLSNLDDLFFLEENKDNLFLLDNTLMSNMSVGNINNRIELVGNSTHNEYICKDLRGFYLEYLAGVVEGKLELLKSDRYEKGVMKLKTILENNPGIKQSEKLRSYVLQNIKDAGEGKNQSLSVLYLIKDIYK